MKKPTFFVQKKFFEKLFFLNNGACYDTKKIPGKGSMLKLPSPKFFLMQHPIPPRPICSFSGTKMIFFKIGCFIWQIYGKQTNKSKKCFCQFSRLAYTFPKIYDCWGLFSTVSPEKSKVWKSAQKQATGHIWNNCLHLIFSNDFLNTF